MFGILAQPNLSARALGRYPRSSRKMTRSFCEPTTLSCFDTARQAHVDCSSSETTIAATSGSILQPYPIETRLSYVPYSFQASNGRARRFFSTATVTTTKRTTTLARVMLPSDANWAGNVHGGTIMEMIEEAAGVAANRYFNNHESRNRNNDNQKEHLQSHQWVLALLARVEKMTFHNPVHIGDVAEIHANVVYASNRTVAVSVHVEAEHMTWSSTSNHIKQQKREHSICNRALVWMVGVILPPKLIDPYANRSNNTIVSTAQSMRQLERAHAPQFPTPDPNGDPTAWNEYEVAAKAYKQRHTLLASNQSKRENIDITMSIRSNASQPTRDNLIPYSPDYSAIELAQVMLPSDSFSNSGLIGGGVILKLMDNASAIAARRHCDGANTVTVSVDATDLIAPVYVGDVVRVLAKPVFTSRKSIEMKVRVVAERYLSPSMFSTNTSSRQTENAGNDDDATVSRTEILTTSEAHFTFVSLNADGKILPMRPLQLSTEEDRNEFERAKQRYDERKKK